MVLESEAWGTNPDIQKLPTLDISLVFEDYNRVRERELEKQVRRAQVEKERKERKTREGFKVCRNTVRLNTRLPHRATGKESGSRTWLSDLGSQSLSASGTLSTGETAALNWSQRQLGIKGSDLQIRSQGPT